MKQNFLSKRVFLSFLLLGQVAIAENYKKVVLSSFTSETVAQDKYNKLLEGIESKVKFEKEKYPFDIVMRESGKHFIIAAEPFKYVREAQEVLAKLKNEFPSAYINNNAQKFDENEIADVSSEKIKDVIAVDEVETVNKEVVEEEQAIEASKEEVTIEKKAEISFYTLEDMINELIFTDPEIKEKLFQYNAIMEDINISDAGYLPTLDFVGKIGRKEIEKDGIPKDGFDTSELTLRLVQNLFNGFGTQAAVNRDEARAKAAFNKYIEVAQDKMYRAIEAYIKVVRYNEVLKIAKDNVKVHEETLLKIQDRYEKGFSTLSEVERVKGRLALSKSNYVSETNNLFDAKFNFHKSLGRYVDETTLVMPEFKSSLPKTLEHATDIAIHNNPSILVANYDIKAIQESLQYTKRRNYPTLDIELERSRYNNLTGTTAGTQDDTSAMLVLNYNLYSGGADKAEKQKYVSLLNYEYAHKNKLKRDVIEALGLSWSAYKMINEQYKYQVEYRDLTANTKIAYDEEFQLGRRTLIDLLDVQDEVNNIKIKVIHNSYDLLFSKYRVLDAMGELYKSFGKEFKEDYKEDKLLAYVDEDNDKILDCEDQCDNSATEETNIYGCQGITCVQVDEIKFDAEIKENNNQLDTTEVQNLWGVKE
ncbi:TolC family outer membrane protein [Poseidonibacter lekithochrous]|uniref:TolC family outer membrane protein n=1 Tax=Poseidonibacter lekithochrous TaxID=1904463 RepID=UPI0008FC8695|nr:TolC family outer membrane protein [Poseidonibacter lekithochrous]QKJ21815.1 type I secretion system outer membrane protein, TolC family [Poseidonibacter lekithochrous]